MTTALNDTDLVTPNAAMDDEQSPPRYVVGIDLGTTNSAMCCIDTHRDDWQIECFAVTQAIAQGESEKRETLPSFHYEPTADELKAGTCELPWQQEHSYCVGVFARDNGRSTPGRMVESAKSWLCHAGVDRRAALLPWHPAEDVERLSPVQVSSRFLRHLREAWDHSHPQYPLSKQDVVLTIPASFDEVARELTVTAAREAGLPRIFLIEEPQAAFYSWVDAHRETWEQIVSPGQKILVCDIGGGTSDFSLIHVRSGENGKLQFHRVAVGDHLLLGGDNLDLALAHYIEQKLADEGKLGGENKLSPRQWSTLISACRHAKETLLDFQAPESYTVVLPGSGSKLIGGSLQTDVTQQELHNLFVEGFLPEVELTDKPAKRQSGFQEFGLPYAPDPAMTKYLAHFLNSHHQTSGSSSIDEDPLIAARPDVVLFNGGFFASPILRSRLINCLQRWFANTSVSDKPWSPLVLKNDRLDLAVARGAAYFGMVRRGIGIRIVAGLARSYYIGVEKADGSPAAMCLIAAGTEPGAEPTVLDQHFRVRTSEPVEFPIYVSGTRLTDQPGQLLAIDPEQLTPLPPIRTVLTSRSSEDNTIDARVSVRLNEIGTLEMWCQQVDSTRRWQLQFDVRSATETDREAHTGIAERTGIVDDSIIRTAEALIESTFADESTASPDRIAKQIAAELQISRNDWPPSLLRGMWPALMASESARRRSPKHECRWLNLTGFCLRPGFGMAADDWRVEETWKTLRGKLAHSGSANLTEWRILCRRVAGGLNAGRQNQLAAPLLSAIRQKHRQMMTGRGKATDYASSTHEAAEIWRLLGSLERISSSVRAELGGIIIDLLPRAVVQPIRPSMLWALGRLGARIPIYGPLNLVLPAQTIVPWIEHLLRNEDLTDSVTQLALMQLGRRTDDRYRDISAAMRDRVVAALSQAGAKPHIIELVTNVGQLEQEEANQIFGESLPAGLRIG